MAVNKPSTTTTGQLSDSFEGHAVYGASGIAGYVRSFQHEQSNVDYQSEQTLENDLVARLVVGGHSKVDLSDEVAVLTNLRRQLKTHNAAKLSGRQVLIERLMSKVDLFIDAFVE